jgi:hypothetical protein
MIIHSYGLFWRADEIDWHPGAGYKGKFRLLGRKGNNKPGLKVSDFREQKGIYILYGNYGARYVGLTRKQTLGGRLKQHLSDEHEEMWDRFSWFGFRAVLRGTDENGFQKLKKMPNNNLVRPDKVIGDVEALPIKSMALVNKANMKFASR